ncbi:MAG: DUF3796 domain-containing protein [Clostridia bacterium]|nr:DUF3796 domain-containing protein [Clostridia bacterium]
MNRNWFKCLWVLGFLGLLGYFTDNVGFYGFFGFFGSLAFFGIKDDERLIDNINKAARNAFVVSMVICITAIVFVAILRQKDLLYYGIPVIFVAQYFTFVASYLYYDFTGR